MSSDQISAKLMLSDHQIAAAELSDWRKLAQGLHARFLTRDFATGARFVTAIAKVGDVVGHHPQVRMDSGFVDLKLITDDAIYRDPEGTDHRVEWVTQQDLDLAVRISEVAETLGLDADPASLTTIEIVLDTAHVALVAPVWSALLTGGQEAQGRGTSEEDVRDPTWRVPILWFQPTEEHETPRQRFHLDVQVPHDVAEQRIAAAVAAGGVIVGTPDPTTTIIADPDGNRACVGVAATGPADAR
jgi:4a-hydroxytetrahydrobiopterin dehydratase